MVSVAVGEMGGSTDLGMYSGNANINTTGTYITTIGNSTNGLLVNGGLTISVTGEASKSIAWVATINTVKITG